MVFYSRRLERVYLTPLLVSGELGDGMDAPSPARGHRHTVRGPTRGDNGHGKELSPSVQWDRGVGVGPTRAAAGHTGVCVKQQRCTRILGFRRGG